MRCSGDRIEVRAYGRGLRTGVAARSSNRSGRSWRRECVGPVLVLCWGLGVGRAKVGRPNGFLY